MPKRLKQAIANHVVVTVPEVGWAGKQNGESINLAVGRFDVFVTIDQNLPAQQHPLSSNLSVVVLVARSNRYRDLQPLIPRLLQTLGSIRQGQLVKVGLPEGHY